MRRNFISKNDRKIKSVDVKFTWQISYLPTNGASLDRYLKTTKWYFLNIPQCYRFVICKTSLSMSLPPSLLWTLTILGYKPCLWLDLRHEVRKQNILGGEPYSSLLGNCSVRLYNSDLQESSVNQYPAHGLPWSYYNALQPIHYRHVYDMSSWGHHMSRGYHVCKQGAPLHV